MVRRTNKNDLLLLGMMLAFAVIAMTSFSACSTTKVVKKEHFENVESKDSTFVKSTDSHTEVSASSISIEDSISETTIHEVITIYDIVRDTTGMPILMPSGEPMTYAKEKKDYTLTKDENKVSIVEETISEIKDTSEVVAATVEVRDSLVVITEKSASRKNKSIASLIVLILACGGVLLLGKLMLDKISG